MAKPFRVKRAGKYIGSWLVWVDGERVNLDTKDAGEARRRASLAEKGKWPAEESAARATKETLDGGPDESEADEASTAPLPAAAEVDPTPRAEVAPPPAVSVSPIVSPAADVANEVAVDFSGELKAAMEEGGSSMSEMLDELPDLAAGTHLFLQGHAIRIAIGWFKGGKRPDMVTLDPSSKVRQLLGKAWIEQAKRWDVGLDQVTPLKAICICTALAAIQMVGVMLDDPAPEPSPPAVS